MPDYYPSKASSLLQNAWLHFLLKKEQQAEKGFEILVKSLDGETSALANLGLCYLDLVRGNFEEALEKFKVFSERYEEDPYSLIFEYHLPHLETRGFEAAELRKLFEMSGLPLEKKSA